LKKFSPDFAEDVYENLTLQAVLACHDVPGGTSPVHVRKALASARERLTALEGGLHAHA
jgi:argininosuccinate lyase